MKKILQRAPLVHAVVHLEISRCPDLKLGNSTVEDAVQSQMIDFGFPDYIVSEHRIIELNANRPQEANETPHRETIIPRRVFRSGSQMELVEISESAIILKASDYSTFEAFSDTFFRVLGCFLEHVPQCQKAVLKRIGLRYVDVIAPTPDHQLTDHIHRDFLPASLTQLEGSQKLHGQTLTRAATAEGSTIKVAFEELPVRNKSVHKALPEDLGEHDQRCTMKLKGHQWWSDLTSDTYGILDIDHVHFFQDTPTMDAARVAEKLRGLYQATSQVFWDVLTEKSKQDWGATDVHKEGSA